MLLTQLGYMQNLKKKKRFKLFSPTQMFSYKILTSIYEVTFTKLNLENLKVKKMFNKNSWDAELHLK